MKIVIANDHAATDLKFEVKEYIESLGHEVINIGTDSHESCHYPEYGKKAADIYSFQNDALDRTALPIGELYTPYQVEVKVGENTVAQRWPYPQASLDYNPNHPAVKDHLP